MFQAIFQARWEELSETAFVAKDSYYNFCENIKMERASLFSHKP